MEIASHAPTEINIDDFTRELVAGVGDCGEVVMLKKDKIDALFRLIPQPVLAEFVKRQRLQPPVIGHEKFSHWVSYCRGILALSQTELASKVGMLPDVICKLEKNNPTIKAKRRERVRDWLLAELRRQSIIA